MNKFKQRMLNVAKALREATPGRFSQGDFGHFCGTPSCALGHYAARKDMQRTFGLTFWGGRLTAYGDLVNGDFTPIQRHFGISNDEAWNLFGMFGCDDAQSPDEAIEFIEAFAAKKWPEESASAKD